MTKNKISSQLLKASSSQFNKKKIIYIKLWSLLHQIKFTSSFNFTIAIINLYRISIIEWMMDARLISTVTTLTYSIMKTYINVNLKKKPFYAVLPGRYIN